MDKETREEAEKLINDFVQASINDVATQKNLYEQFDSILEKHFLHFHSKILRTKLKSLIMDSFIYGLRSGIYFAKVREERE